MYKMKVSIITVCFNSERTIRDTLQAVKNQTYSNIEYIVVDGNSSDSTNKIISEFSDTVYTHVSEPDLGLYDAMNKGIKLASGDIVGILNSDDLFFDNTVIERVVEEFNNKIGLDAIFADVGFYDQELLRKVRHYSSKMFSVNKLKYGIMPAHPSLYIKRDICKKIGEYSLKYKIASDFDYIVRLFNLDNIAYSYVQREFVKMRIGGVSTSGIESNFLLNKEILISLKSNGIHSSYLYLLLKYPKKVMGFIFK